MMDSFGNKVIFFVLLAGFIVMRGIFAVIAHQSGLSSSFMNNGPADQKEQKIHPIAVIVLVCILSAFIFYAIWPEERNILIVPLPDWLHCSGMALGIVSLLLQISVHITLQRNWSAARRSGKSNVVITNGLYSCVRHPMYLALILLLTGLSLISGFSLFWPITLLSVPLFNNVARKEETSMVRQFGDQYVAYMKCTGGFFPRLVARPAKRL
jgi:protein-S-isoprenylcysteine O-methyltransferase Ste14